MQEVEQDRREGGGPLVYTVPETAAYLRCHDQSVRKLIREGRLRSVRIGRKVLVPRAAIEEFLNGAGPR